MSDREGPSTPPHSVMHDVGTRVLHVGFCASGNYLIIVSMPGVCWRDRGVSAALKSTGPSIPWSWGRETMPLPSGLSSYHAGESVVLSAMRIRPSGSQPSAD